MTKTIPAAFWEAYSNSVSPSIVADLKVRTRSNRPMFLTVEGVRGDSDTPIQNIRALLDDLVENGYAELEQRQRCPHCLQDLSEEAIETLRCVCGEEFSQSDLPETTRTYVRKGMASRDIRWAITIHGMNTAGVWQQDFSWRLAKTYGYSIPVGLYKYGNVKLAPFLSLLRRRHRRKLLAYFKKVRMEMVASGYGDRPDVIAHSFGTWLLSQVLISDQSDDPIRVARVILTGSIVRPDFDWADLVRSDRVEAVLCHQAENDVPARFAHWFIRGTGPSSVRGFNDREGVQHVVSPGFGHSDYFSEAHMGAVLTDHWAPFLTRMTEPVHESGQQNRPVPWRSSRLRLLTFALLYLVLLVLVGLAAFLLTSVIFGFSPAIARVISLFSMHKT
jgi:hypothetical protein